MVMVPEQVLRRRLTFEDYQNFPTTRSARSSRGGSTWPRARDRITKRRIYAELRVPHYWMVHTRDRAIAECVPQPDGRYRERIVTAPDSFRPELFPDLAIELIRLFA